MGVLGYLLFFYKLKLRGKIMRIDFLKLLNFRNYKHLETHFHPSLNLIYGKNGSGKTNLVEAIYVLALTRSFRLVGDKTLILEQALLSKIEGDVVNKNTTNYRVLISKDGKKVKINNNKISKISDYISKITVVLFHPDDLRFIKDAPSTRRKNLNISISLINTTYLQYLNMYKILLKQRNSYLKQMLTNGSLKSEYLDILTSKLVDYGMYIYQKRNDYVKFLEKYLGFFYQKITGVSDLKIEYVSHYHNNSKEEILTLYQKNLKKDISFGKTHLGVHMDDLKFLVNGRDLKEYGSEGQQKNAIISYKFSEIEILKEMTGSTPILILDDLFSELDKEKIQNILNLLKSDIQTFITITDLERFGSLSTFSYKSIHVENGNIVEESVHERRE